MKREKKIILNFAGLKQSKQNLSEAYRVEAQDPEVQTRTGAAQAPVNQVQHNTLQCRYVHLKLRQQCVDMSSAAKSSIMQISLRSLRLLMSRHIQVKLSAPQRCSTGHSSAYTGSTLKCRTGLCNVMQISQRSGRFLFTDKFRCSSGPCSVGTSKCYSGLCSVDMSIINSDPCAYRYIHVQLKLLCHL